MVGAAGLEPATLCLEGRCSIQLSYAPTGVELALAFILTEFSDLRRRTEFEAAICLQISELQQLPLARKIQ